MDSELIGLNLTETNRTEQGTINKVGNVIFREPQASNIEMVRAGDCDTVSVWDSETPETLRAWDCFTLLRFYALTLLRFDAWTLLRF